MFRRCEGLGSRHGLVQARCRAARMPGYHDVPQINVNPCRNFLRRSLAWTASLPISSRLSWHTTGSAAPTPASHAARHVSVSSYRTHSVLGGASLNYT